WDVPALPVGATEPLAEVGADEIVGVAETPAEDRGRDEVARDGAHLLALAGRERDRLWQRAHRLDGLLGEGRRVPRRRRVREEEAEDRERDREGKGDGEPAEPPAASGRGEQPLHATKTRGGRKGSEGLSPPDSPGSAACRAGPTGRRASARACRSRPSSAP